nr:Ig-like domain-containing protein [uncultured Allomuricauda sp.]
MNFLRPIMLLLAASTILYSCSSDSEDPVPEPDVIAPNVDFSIPGNSGTSSTETPVVSNQIVVDIDAQDAGGVAKVEAFINNEKVGEDTTAPYQITIDVSNYTSKNNLTAKFTDYTLKVTVTDTSGNETSKEQVIHIDNELPSITEVSLADGQVIGGDTNAVTFNVSDNEGLNSVKTYLNDTLLEEITEDIYEVNLNTSELSDGENFLKIEATDLADNITTYEVPFISDNTGPEIISNTVEDGQILDESLLISTGLSDIHSQVSFIDIALGEQNLLTTDVAFPAGTDGQVDLVFDSETIATGEHVLKITASDALGNTSSLEITVQILRRLITINIPTGFYNPESARLFVFASGMDGQLLDVKRIYSDTEMVRLHTTNETVGDFEYMLTFGEYISGSIGNATEFTTVQNISPEVMPVINLNTYQRFLNQSNSYLIPTENFDFNDELNIVAQGFDYYGNFNQIESGSTSDISIVQRQNVSSILQSNSFYLALYNNTLNTYSYTLLDSNIAADLVISADMFTTQGVEQRFYDPIMNGQAFESSTIDIRGYLNQDDFNNNINHLIHNHGYGYIPLNGIPYFINDTFTNYKYTVRINDYFTERTGQPEGSFTPVDWTIDYSFLNNQIDITKSGIGHTVGKIFIDSETPEVINGLNVSYRWNLVYDSQKMDQVILPQIPEEIQSWGFYTIYENDGFKVQQVEIKGFQGIPDYNSYLSGVIKDNKYSFVVSLNMESKFNSTVQGYYNRAPNFLLD